MLSAGTWAGQRDRKVWRYAPLGENEVFEGVGFGEVASFEVTASSAIGIVGARHFQQCVAPDGD